MSGAALSGCIVVIGRGGGGAVSGERADCAKALVDIATASTSMLAWPKRK